MNKDDIFEHTKDAYLCLIQPIRSHNAYREELAPLVALVPSVPSELIADLITGVSWRERLLGLCMAMSQRSAIYTVEMLQSLRDPCGISIVPTCAALAVLAQYGAFVIPPSFADTFDRTAFDGEVGWAIDKLMYVAGLRAEDVPGDGPNYGQIFDDHVEVYSWLYAT